MKKVTRREFFTKGSLMTGGAITGIALGRCLMFPPVVQAAGVEFSESSCNEKIKTNQKILVTYASRTGSTGGVADKVKQVLCDSNAMVDTCLIENVKNLDSYHAVIIGSAIQRSKWLPEAVDFVKTNRKILTQVPVAYFLTCLTLYFTGEKFQNKARAYLNPLLETVPEIKPVDIGLFAGVLDYEKLSFIEELVMKRKMKKKGIPEGDFRDWNEIESWSERLCLKMIGKQDRAA